VPDLRLWTFRLSPFAGKVRAAFAEKGVEVELVEIHPGRRPARLKELNPLGRVPVLEVGDTVIRESWVVCEWLDETHPEPPLWPADPQLRAWTRGWSRYVDDVPAASFFLGMNKLAFGLRPDDRPDEVERLHRRVPKSWPLLEEALGVHDGPWLAGEQFTLADLSAMALAVRLPQWAAPLAPDAQRFPRTDAWMAALRERPSAAAIDAKGAPVVSADGS
jgi:glutathione S-transferase